MGFILCKVFSKLLLSGVLLFCHATLTFSQRKKIWVNADTGNKTDDVYAIARLLADTTIQVMKTANG